MHSRFYGRVVTLIAVPTLLGGCVQATRHSNVMLFGTNTSFGLKVGTDTAQVPSILVGYNRQEAVIMPLLANTRDAGGSSNRLLPCDVSGYADAVSGNYAVHPCSFVAFKGDAQDSYSVIASFGASFGGSSNADGVEAKGGLAQYFATGMAAQILAVKGGAALVSTGEATKEAAIQSGKNPVDSLFATPAQIRRSEIERTVYAQFQGDIVGVLSPLSDADALAFLDKFENALGVTLLRGISPLCNMRDKCIEMIKGGVYRGQSEDVLKSALNNTTK